MYTRVSSRVVEPAKSGNIRQRLVTRIVTYSSLEHRVRRRSTQHSKAERDQGGWEGHPRTSFSANWAGNSTALTFSRTEAGNALWNRTRISSSHRAHRCPASLASVDWNVLRFGKECLGTTLVRDDLMPRHLHVRLVPSVPKV